MAPSKPEESIFHAALQLDEPGERAAYLDGACGDNARLRQRVEALLSADQHGEYLEPPAASLAAAALIPEVGEKPGSIIGPYKLLEQIGEGGMGLVFMAEQSQPLRRRVALKIIKPGLDTQAVIARFDAERQALALMDHPNIARVYDAGATESGRPFFVMELVRGAPITDHCRDRNLGLRERLELFIEVCQAVQHAHQKGVIHRDLKPTNILVSLSDTKPVPKVIDFGVAKATTQPLTERTLFTSFAQIIGTPLYMSPEQAELGNQDVDTRSDVYSLGVVLYELLTGTTPFDADRLRSAGADEMRRIIREEEPLKPSTRATTFAAATTLLAPGNDGRQRCSSLAVKGDLDWIVMKALDKDRRRRYESASAVAADLLRYLENQPIHARPPTYRDKIAKWSRRHRHLVASAGTSAVALVVMSIILLASSNVAITRERNAARAAAVREHEMAEEARKDREQAILARQHAEKTLMLAIDGFAPVGAAFGPDGNLYVTSWGVEGVLRFDRSTGMLIDTFVSSASGGLHSPEALAFGTDATGDGIPELYVTSGGTNSVLRYNGQTGAYLDTFISPESGGLSKPTGLAFGADGRAYVAGFGSANILRYDGRTGEFLDEFVPTGTGGLSGPQTPMFGPDGNLYVTSFGSGQVLRFHGSTGEFIDAFVERESGGLQQPEGLTFGPDGKLYVSSNGPERGCILRYDGTTGQFIDRLARPEGFTEDGQTLVFGPDQLLYVCNSGDCSVVRYDVAEGKYRDHFITRQKFFDQLLLTYGRNFGHGTKDPAFSRKLIDVYFRHHHEYEEVCKLVEEVVELSPKDIALRNEMAWDFATTASDDPRVGALAVKLATEACEMSDYRVDYILDTLAAAYAQAGDFDAAIRWEQKAIDPKLRKQSEAWKRLESYEAHKPWRGD